MLVKDIIRPKSELGEDDLVTIVASYLATTKSKEACDAFLNNETISFLKDQNSDVQKFGINKYFQSVLVIAAGSRMERNETGLVSRLDVRPALLNITNRTDNVEWYNLIVNGVIKFCYDNNIELM